MMAQRFPLKMLVAVVLAGVMAAGAVGPRLAPRSAAAQAPNPTGNPVVGLLNLISAGNRRGRVYRSARVTQQEMDAYYDTLIAQARRQLQARELLGANQPQLRVYIKLVASLEAERAAVTRQIEAEKNQARREFNHSLNQEVVQVVVRAPGAQRILNDAHLVVNALRENISEIQSALRRGEVVDGLVNQLTDRLTRIPFLQNEVRNLGGGLGDKIDQELGGLLRRTSAAAREGQDAMRQALDEANRLDAAIVDFQNEKRFF
ncbi:MAG: hypothetical protein IH586_12225 [Anaerolineaceae bacterium]|nr:hypothetical protein [Anaerolineaceae bacterium]